MIWHGLEHYLRFITSHAIFGACGPNSFFIRLHRLLFAVRLGSDARQRDLHRAFIGAVRRGVGARQRVVFAVRPMESARQILWRTAKTVFPVVSIMIIFNF
jgi:hypothetical protein